MEIQFQLHYFVYITTNKERSAFKVGITSNLSAYWNDIHSDTLFDEERDAFPYLLHFEKHEDISRAVKRESRLAGFSQRKLKRLINRTNPGMAFLSPEVNGGL